MRRNDVFIETLTSRGSLSFGSAAGGAYTGDGLTDFMLGYLSAASVGIAPLHGTPNQYWYAGYFQDDYKVTNSLTLNLGLRYDYFQPWKEKHDHWAGFDLNTNQVIYASTASSAQGGRALAFGDTGNWGPRFGFAWRPLGRQNTVVRGGYGIYYEQEHPSGPILNAINPPPGGIYSASAPTSGFGFTRDFIAPALSVTPQPTLFWDNFSLGAGNVGARVAVQAQDPHMRNTMVQQWNLTVQQRVGNNLFELGYVANKANRIFTSENVNVPGDFNSLYVLGTAAYIRPQYSGINWRMSDGSGNYHSLQAKFERRVAGAVFLTSYTWGHAISDAEQGQSAVGVGNPGNFHFLYDRHLDKSSTTFDIRQRFTTGILYQIPYRRNQQGALGKVLGAWEVNLIVTAQTGNGAQVSDGTGLATNYSRFDRPDLVGNPILPRGDRAESHYFNTDAFQVVTTPRFGTAPRMMIRQPGLWTPDLSLAKNLRVTERFHLVIRADAYNCFNHANWQTVDATIRDTSNPNIGPPGTLKNPYGRVNSFGNPREMQVSLKVLF
jgi:hypothetical protein